MSKSSAASFGELLRPHLPYLHRLACRLTTTTADAEDLVQDVMVKLFSRCDELTSIRELTPWLGRVLYNQFIDDTRRYGRQPLKLVTEDCVDELVGPSLDPQRDTVNAHESQRLMRALMKLSEDHRVVVMLHDVDGHTLAEIQELTGIALGTLKSRLHRARARLREILKKDGTFLARASCNNMNGDNVDAL